MATKPSDLLHRLPSASELLEKPPIRRLVDRWNRSVVASGVRSFLDELRSDLERRAADVELPSLRELAERAARHVVELQQPPVRPAINATGQFFGPGWIGVPLADDALERSLALGGSFVLRASDTTRADVAATLCRLTGAEAATVVHSYSGALWLASAALAGGHEALIARGEVGQLEPNCQLASVVASASVILREVGSVNRVTAADYEATVHDQTAAVLRHSPDDYRLLGDTATVELESLVGLCRDRELALIDLLGAAPLVDGLPTLDDAWPSAAASVKAGAHLAIVRGDGLVGGPRSGILLGTRRLIERIAAHPMFAAWQADPATAAALAATLALYDDPQQLRQGVPLYQLLSASAENLRQRAERLAPQLAQAEDVQSATAVATENCFGLAPAGNCQRESYAIALAAAHDDVTALDKRLRNAPMPIVGRRDGDRLLLDLRTVLPRQDQRLVDMVVGPCPAKSNPAAARGDGSS